MSSAPSDVRRPSSGARSWRGDRRDQEREHRAREQESDGSRLEHTARRRERTRGTLADVAGLPCNDEPQQDPAEHEDRRATELTQEDRGNRDSHRHDSREAWASSERRHREQGRRDQQTNEIDERQLGPCVDEMHRLLGRS
jgi:hypothetical protein